jgi:hypothetical protein
MPSWRKYQMKNEVMTQVEIRVCENGYMVSKAKPMWEDPLQQASPMHRPYVFETIDSLFNWMRRNMEMPPSTIPFR